MNMRTLWVLENVKGNKSFYNELQILLLLSSITLWKKHHPEHILEFHCDEITYNFFDALGILPLWNRVSVFSYPEKINRRIFWSSPKSKIISEIDSPVIIVDHDFLIFTSIDQYLGNDIIYTYDERSDNWYPDKRDAYNKKLTNPVEFIVPYAANVSLFYLPNPEFSRKYGARVLKNHEEFTAMESPTMTSNHMILSEQYMLRQWLESDDIPYRCLSKNIWDCHKLGYIKGQITENGIWNLKESLLYYKHYGSDEKKTHDREDGYDYDETIAFLSRCIKYNKSIDVEKLRTDINQILTK